MNIIEKIQKAFTHYISTTFNLDEQTALSCTPILNTDVNKQQFGDLNSNAALILAKKVGRKPIDIAQQITQQFTHPFITKIEIAGPGFLNLFFTNTATHELAHDIFTHKSSFFKSDLTKKERYCIEFVSANPTGPLHFGHGRGGIIGDVLGNILQFLGHEVNKEFYINDAGNQIQKLGESLKVRYQQCAGINAEIPEGGYFGEYLIAIAQELFKEHGNRLLNQPDSFFADYAKGKLLEHIKATLTAYGIVFDTWFSEKSLHDSGAIEQGINTLNHYMYEKEGALWFKSTDFGDDKDRVVRKASGELTYAAADIAYMLNKAARGYTQSIMVLGHDHHSYAVRLEAIRQALKLEVPLHVILYQLVNIKKSGKLAKLSKRAGNIVSLEDIIEVVGKDIARYFYLNRKADAQLEFDLDLALSQTEENPVYYVQYAYVRLGSILQKAASIPELANIQASDADHITDEEKLLLKKIISLKELLANIQNNLQTHLLTYYVHELTQLFSTYYAKNRVIDPTHISTSRGRLLIVTILRETITTCFDILGISQPERM